MIRKDLIRLSKKIFEQLIRFDGKNTFVEIVNAFNIGKVQLNFIEYDLKLPQKNRQINKVELYLDIIEAVTLSSKIINGRFGIEANDKRREQQAKGYKYCLPVYISMGGVNAEMLARRGKARSDGKAISRQFKISPGDKIPWILSGEFGPGEEMENRLIKPAYNVPQGKKFGQPEGIVRVPLTDDDLLKFAVVLKMSIESFYNNINFHKGDASINLPLIESELSIFANKIIEAFGLKEIGTANYFKESNKKDILKFMYPYIKQAYRANK